MIRPIRSVLAIAFAAATLGGCATSGIFPAANVTNVTLGQEEFEIVATGVAGEATAAYLFGVSAAIGPEMRTISLFRLEGEPMLYAAALDDLWANFEATYGEAEGRSLALVNVRFDTDATNLLVYTRARISVRADVVEFDG